MQAFKNNFLKIIALAFVCSCNRQVVPENSYAFHYIKKESKDTLTYYAYKNIDTAIFYAKKERKNILVIFSSYSSMAMRNMEWKTLSLYPGRSKIQDHFVLLWLAVDDRRILKDTSQVVFWYNQYIRLKEIGDKNKYFEETVFGFSTQPFFCFIDSLKKPFGKVIGYERDERKLDDFIASGLKE